MYPNLWQISEIKSALKNQIIKADKINAEINEVIIDSRKKSTNGLFIAIKGGNNDGHNFINQAFNNGCILAIVDKIPQGFADDNRIIMVKDSIGALNDLAIFSRNRTKAKIIAVTGSVGKTGVKEMLKTVFSEQSKVFATFGNLNNNFGLPLCLCNMSANTDYGIFEMGMNNFGEIENLSRIARPHIAVITNIASAHIGNFKSEEEIAFAKAEIFSGIESGGFAVINSDSKYFHLLKSKAVENGISDENVISFGTKEISDFRLLSIEKTEQKIKNFISKIDVFIAESNQQVSYLINTINQAIIFNSLIAVTCLQIFKQDLSIGLKALENLSAIKGRGNLIDVNKNGIKFTIIDDTYNANPASMEVAFKFLMDLKKYQMLHYGKCRSIAFIGDMLELGELSLKEHLSIVKKTSLYGIDKVLLVGSVMNSLNFEIDSERLIGNLESSSLDPKFYPQNGDIILIKGSRGIKMEKLIDKLLQSDVL